MAKEKIKADTKVKKINVEIPEDVAIRHSLYPKGSDNVHPDISLKYYDFNYKCFSCLDKQDLKSLTDLTKRFSQMTWRQVMSQASKGKGKRGLAPTIIERSSLPNTKMISSISDDIPIFELRLASDFRVFGFRSYSTFYLMLLDPEHKTAK